MFYGCLYLKSLRNRYRIFYLKKPDKRRSQALALNIELRYSFEHLQNCNTFTLHAICNELKILLNLLVGFCFLNRSSPLITAL